MATKMQLGIRAGKSGTNAEAEGPGTILCGRLGSAMKPWELHPHAGPSSTFASGSNTAGSPMPRSLPLLTQPAPPTPECHSKESIDDPKTGLRGVFEDLGVLLAIMLGYDMAAPQSGGRPRAAARLVPPSIGK